MRAKLVLESLHIRDLRNLVRVDVRPARDVTLVTGDNGHGKTSLLEAIYFVATSKSFRTSKLGEMVRHGAEALSVRASLREDEAPSREQIAAVHGARRVLKIEGKRPFSLASYALRSPVVCFHARELELSSGPAAARRTLLDRVAIFLDPSAGEHLLGYREAMRSRQRALALRGVEAADVPAFEQVAASQGAAVTRARRRAAEALLDETRRIFPRLGAPGLVLEGGYAAGGSDDETTMRSEFAARRAIDRARGAPSFGPHRDDLALVLDGKSTRIVASQGQHRAVAIALKLAELETIAAARGITPILLLDDVSSELDRDRTAALLDFLRESRGQVFVTTTRPELLVEALPSGGERAQWRVRRGSIEA